MPITKAPYTIIASSAGNLPNTSNGKNLPVLVGSTVNAPIYGGVVTWSITNGGSAPTTPVAITIQISSDGAAWRDLWTAGGDTVANSVNTGCVELPRGAMQVRAIGYSSTAPNTTTNAVTVAVEIQGVTGL